jgi:hypothetical protein
MPHTNRGKPGVRPAVFARGSLAGSGLLAQNGSPPQTIDETTVLPSDSTTRFGRSLPVHSDALVVGVHHEEDNGVQAGAAYVYRFDGSSPFAKPHRQLASRAREEKR